MEERTIGEMLANGMTEDEILAAVRNTKRLIEAKQNIADAENALALALLEYREINSELAENSISIAEYMRSLGLL